MAQGFDRITAGISCFLLRGTDGFVLVDTGPRSARRRLLRGLEAAGCGRGDLRLVLITHGDSDHIGSCAYLRETYGAKLAAHPLESRAIETGDMRANRSTSPDRAPWIFRALLPVAAKLGRPRPFTTDLFLDDGQSLAEYGIDASVLHLPGHTKGSVAVLTGDGDLFCGDLFWSYRKPGLHLLIDDVPAARASIERLRTLPIATIHPAHGKAFAASVLNQEFPA